ncbi:MAG: HAD family hydrolase [Bacteroidales bacterium]|nr:HAD family hydrolase [Bacteroidales bacterium]
MNKYEVVIFDLDGTILDTLPDLSTAVNYALSRRGLPPHSLEEYKMMVGEGVRNLCRLALDSEDEQVLNESLQDFKAYYVAHILDKTRPYEGMPELMAALGERGIAVAVVSNKFQEGARKLIRHFYPDIPEERVLGEIEGRPRKPDPAMIEAVMSSFPEGTRCCVVGDAWTDIEAGKAYGCDTIGVSWGYRYTEALYKAGADVVADTVDELKSLLIQTI